MKKFITFIVALTFLITGCTNKNEPPENAIVDFKGYHFPTDKEKKEFENNLLKNPNILTEDKLIKVGDLGLEIEPVQNPPTENDLNILKKNRRLEGNGGEVKLMHHNPNSPALHETFPNWNVPKIGGSYVNNVVGKAWDYYGTPYEYGSDRTTDKTFDCSDFVYWVHLWTLGMELPKDSRSQWEYVKKFSKRKYTDLSQAKRGDVLFFMSYKGWQPHDYNGVNVKSQPVAHCGIYVGNGYLLHTASAKTGGVRYDKIKGSHLEYRFIGGGQVIQ